MNDKIQCMVCGEWYHCLNSHILAHSLSCEDYRQKYPNAPFLSDVNRKKLSKACKGIKPSLKSREKMSEAAKGKKISLETRKKISEAKKGKGFSFEHRRKLSETHKGLFAGERHPLWRGGSSKGVYGFGWSPYLREEIRGRDEYRCQFCGDLQVGRRKFHVHHIDRDRDNNCKTNLICLCISCHMKVSHSKGGKELAYRLYFHELVKSKNDIELAAS